MADKCDPIRLMLHDLKVERQNTDEFINEPPDPDDDPSGPIQKPKKNPKWQKLDNQVRSAERSVRDCELSLLPSTPVPLTLILTSFTCLDQSDEFVVLGFNLEDDEPYAVVFAVDLKTVAGIPTGATNSKATLVGPLADVDIEEVAAPANVIWGLSNAPDMVSSADNLIVIVALMENDSTSPDQVRSTLEAAAQVSLIQNIPALTAQQIARPEFVSRIISALTGAMGLAKVGAPDPDDHIGSVQELQFSQNELDNIYRNLEPVEKSLAFNGDGARYAVKFRMFR